MCICWVRDTHAFTSKSASDRWRSLKLVRAGKMRLSLPWVTCWGLFVARVVSAEGSWQVEHALGDSDFVAAGSLNDGTQVRTSDMCLS